jgi:ankyrin repeat protein
MLDILNKNLPVYYASAWDKGFSSEKLKKNLKARLQEYVSPGATERAIIQSSSGKAHLVVLEALQSKHSFFEFIKNTLQNYPSIYCAIKNILHSLEDTQSPTLYYDNPRRFTSIFLEYIRSNQLEKAREVYQLRRAVLCDPDETFTTAFMRACKEGDLRVVQFLYELDEEAALKDRDVVGRNAFLIACEEGKEDLAGFLYTLSKGKFLKQKDVLSRPLVFGLYEKRKLDVLTRLHGLSEGAILEDADNEGRTLMMLACNRGQLEDIKLFHQLGGDKTLQARDHLKRTPLIRACEQGKEAVAKVLYELGGETLLQDKNRIGRTAFMIACEKGCLSLVKHFCEQASPTILKDKSKHDFTAFELACFSDQVEVVKFLYEFTNGKILEHLSESRYFVGPKVRAFLRSKQSSHHNQTPSQESSQNFRGYCNLLLGEGETPGSKEEIKRAYKQLALKWHPDRWSKETDDKKKEEALEKFKSISQAYTNIQETSDWMKLKD